MYIKKIVGSSISLLLLGAGCVSTAKNNTTPLYTQEAQLYAEDSTTTILRGPEPSFDPAAPAPLETPAANNGGDTVDSVAKQAQYKVNNTTVYVQKITPTSLSYTDAFNYYKAKGAYFQFVQCHGNPGFMSMKSGTKFMLDNRDSKSRTIVIKNSRYVLAAYGFMIATAPGEGVYNILCDDGGSARLNVER